MPGEPTRLITKADVQGPNPPLSGRLTTVTGGLVNPARLIAIGAMAFIGWIIYVANRGQLGIFATIVAHVPLGDKVGHVVLFGLLTVAINAGLGYRTVARSMPIQLGTVLVGVFVTVEEASQFYISTRNGDVTDLAADGVGIGLATVVSHWLGRRTR